MFENLRPSMPIQWPIVVSVLLAVAIIVVISLRASNMMPPYMMGGSTQVSRYPAPMTTPPFTFRSQAKDELAVSQTAAHPGLYGQVDLNWELPNGDEPWRGSEKARRLNNGRNESLSVPMLSYDFESAGRQRKVHNVSALGPAAAAGLMENGGGYARTSTMGENIGYKDLVTVDTLATPGIINNQRV